MGGEAPVSIAILFACKCAIDLELDGGAAMVEMLLLLDRYQTLTTGILAIGAAVIAFLGARRQATAAIQASQLQVEAEREIRAVQNINDQRTLAAILQLQIAAYVTDLLSVQWQISEAVRLRGELNQEQIQVIRAVTKPDFSRYHWRELALLGPQLAGATLTFIDQADEILKTIQKRIPQIIEAKPTSEVFCAFANPFIMMLGESCAHLINLCEQLAAITPGLIDLNVMRRGAEKNAEEVEKNPHIRALRVALGLVSADEPTPSAN